MDESKVISFVKHLSNDTANNKITWQRLNSYQSRVIDNQNVLETILSECEYRHIDYHNSYVTVPNAVPGEIFLIYEDNSPGYENLPRTVGYKIYLHNESNGKISELLCPASALYQLLNAIHSCINNSESDAEDFIDAYFSQKQTDSHQ